MTAPDVASRYPARLGRPLGTGRDWRRRLLLHHAPLASASTLAFVLLMELADGGFLAAELTTVTGYVATGLLGLTLLVGPANLLLRRRVPISTPLARDIGIWAAAYSIVHTVIGLLVHNPPGEVNVVGYFFYPDGTPKADNFGLGNWTGLAALMIVALLLAISNDRALREMKARRWKSLQRLNYTLFVLVVLHAVFYGALTRTTSPFTLMLIVAVIAVLTGQAIGISLWRRRPPRRARPAGPARLNPQGDDHG